jgi:hypothetical protein
VFRILYRLYGFTQHLRLIAGFSAGVALLDFQGPTDLASWLAAWLAANCPAEPPADL